MMKPFLSIKNLTVSLKSSKEPLLRSVSLDLAAGNVLGLVGESGAGKSMIGKAILGILPQAVEITAGEIWLNDQELLRKPAKERRKFIGASTALIPQDPLTALNPSRRIGPQITERLVDILDWKKDAALARALELLNEVQIPDPERVMHSYPHEISGGMRQRILIASAFAANPKLIIADEPTTALDVTVQKQILHLIADLQARHQTSLLFVTHDLGVVSKVCQHLSVLYAGKVIEASEIRDFFKNPKHPYSRALLAATPKYNDPASSLTPVPEEVIAEVEAEIFAPRTECSHVN
ncbi:ABC transporter ATP-binding protein [Kiloniella laminariae]|uniref:ABC transporter ATP-binding protein n=1 Tax=Kiloniella laminariae TaxID=454162 RepID=A0ABT4LRK0_9PROT|nr:ABC transporter ATP-binding protein [Kiloniella laminariae]MCZ4282567.1 ABC transporter ATP-binding protein [Kiloniella laminariae]